ncbi:MAG: YkgJ family cysteine cluster protein [Desulfosarcinaceae bacterium]|jgi:Fe-S-cluster containining protein
MSCDELFECTQCGDCCKGFGGTYVTPDDIVALAAYLKLSPRSVREKYLVRSGDRMVLAQGADGYCVFCKEKRCRIHPVKPRMCRAWPFIEGVLVDVANWDAMATTCPGMKTGYPPEKIRRCVAAAIARLRAD